MCQLDVVQRCRNTESVTAIQEKLTDYYKSRMAFHAVLSTVIVVILASSSEGARGVDFAGALSIDKARCLVKAGYGDFAYVRAWHSYGSFDTVRGDLGSHLIRGLRLILGSRLILVMILACDDLW